MNELDSTRLRELLQYDPSTGIFTWKINRCVVKVGDVAGCVNKASGYYRLRLDGKCYSGHRIAWLYVHGEFPVDQIDHINRIKHDNRISNLRQATQLQNSQNLSNSTGIAKIGKSWIAKVKTNYKSKTIGKFSSKEQAHQAYLEAKQVLHPFFTA